MVQIPNLAGMTTSDAAASLAAAGFKPVIGASIASSYPVGMVSGTQPAGQALRGTTVVILTSVGPPATNAAPPQNTLPPSPGPRVKLPQVPTGRSHTLQVADRSRRMASFPTPRTTLLTAGASALVATGLWIASGFVNHFLLVGERLPTQVVNLMAPKRWTQAGPGGYRISAPTALACILLVLFVAGLTALAVFRLRPGQGRMTLFLATWFAAVAGSFVASTVQARDLPPSWACRPELVPRLVVPLHHRRRYWGLALGWLAGATAVLTFSLSGERADADVMTTG